MPTLSVEEKRLRARLVAWLRYFRAYYDAEDGTDTAFARRIGWSKSAIASLRKGEQAVIAGHVTKVIPDAKLGSIVIAEDCVVPVLP